MKTTLLSVLLAGSALCAGCVRLSPDVASRLHSAKLKYKTITSEMTQAEVVERLGPPASQDGHTFVWREAGPGMNYEKLTMTFNSDGRARYLATSGARFIRGAGVSVEAGSATEIMTSRKD